MDFQQDVQHYDANNSVSSMMISSRLTERINQFHNNPISNQQLQKQIPDIENMEIPFDEGSVHDLDPTPRSNPITASEKKSSLQQQKKEFHESASKYPGLRKQSGEVAEDQKNFLYLIRQKKIIKKFIENTKKAAYIYPQIFGQRFKDIKYEQYLQKRKQFDTQNEQKDKSNLKFLPLFQPQQPFILIWEFLIFIQILFVTWWGPFTLAFANEQTEHSLLYQIIIYFGVLDILMTMNRSIIIQGQIWNDRSLILKYYFRNGFLIDIFSVGTIGLIDDRPNSEDYQVVYFLLSFVLIYFNQKRIRNVLDKVQESFDVEQDAFDLIKVLLIILYFAHISACIWAKVSFQTELFGYKSWIENYHVKDQSPWIQYNYSFYWATMTMVTVGYGDITPQNPYEMVCSILIMIISSILFGYSMNSIGIILKNINDKQQKFRKSQLLINSYMNKNQVNLQLQSKVRNYLKFYIEQDNLQNDEELNTLISKLSPSLKEELLYDIQKKPLKSFNFFLKEVSINVQKQIAYHLQPLHLTPLDLVYEQQSADDNSLYLIVDGQISLIEEQSGTVIHSFGKGECFGQYEFFTGCRRALQARSETFSHIYTLKRENMLSILQNYDEDREKFLNVKDQMLQISNFESIELKCYFCSGLNHYFKKCPYIYYQPDLERLIKQEGFQIQKRLRYHRHKNRSGSALNVLQVCELISQMNNEYHEKFLLEMGVVDHESSVASSQEGKEVTQQISKQSSMDKTPMKEEFTSTGRMFLNATNNNESKQFTVAFEKYCKTRHNKRNNSNHSHQLVSAYTPKASQLLDNQECAPSSKVKRSMSIKDITPMNNKRRKSDDSLQNVAHSQTNKITISLNNVNSKYLNNAATGSSQSLGNEQIDCQKVQEDLDNFRLQFLHGDMDKCQQFKFYFPQHNLNQVLLQYQRQQKMNKNRGRLESSRYSIYFNARQLCLAHRSSHGHRQSKISSPLTKKLTNKGHKRSFLQNPIISLKQSS